MAQSLSVTGITTGGKKSSKTLTYINPEATNAQLQNLAVAYNALSNKTYDGGERTIKQNINEPEPTGKTEPTLTIGQPTNYASETNMKGYAVEITYNGDGEIFYQTNINDNRAQLIGLSTDNNKIFIMKYFSSQNQESIITLNVYASEGTNYQAKKISQEITLGV